jgi:hypothetical protein
VLDGDLTPFIEAYLRSAAEGSGSKDNRARAG